MEVGVGVWLKDENLAWIPGTIQTKEIQVNGKIVLSVKPERVSNEYSHRYEDAKPHVFLLNDESNNELENIKLRNDLSENHVENLINLPYLHEPAILHCLQERYYEGDIYTYTGPILIAVNPFKTVPLYTSQILESYYNFGLMKSQGILASSTLPSLAPHVYAVADAAYRDMMGIIHQGFATGSSFKKSNQASGNQAILISGDSGAGKTESTKIVLKYLTTLGGNNLPESESTRSQQSSKEGTVMDKILLSNPILEAFGNARTIRNDNSSRFGKYIELNFNKRGNLIGKMSFLSIIIVRFALNSHIRWRDSNLFVGESTIAKSTAGRAKFSYLLSVACRLT
jgi:myosin heavy subunit